MAKRRKPAGAPATEAPKSNKIDLTSSPFSTLQKVKDAKGKDVEQFKEIRGLTPDEVSGDEEFKKFSAAAHKIKGAKTFADAKKHLKAVFYDADEHEDLHDLLDDSDTSVDDIKDHLHGAIDVHGKTLRHEAFGADNPDADLVRQAHRHNISSKIAEHVLKLASKVTNADQEGSYRKPEEPEPEEVKSEEKAAESKPATAEKPVSKLRNQQPPVITTTPKRRTRAQIAADAEENRKKTNRLGLPRAAATMAGAKPLLKPVDLAQQTTGTKIGTGRVTRKGKPTDIEIGPDLADTAGDKLASEGKEGPAAIARQITKIPVGSLQPIQKDAVIKKGTGANIVPDEPAAPVETPEPVAIVPEMPIKKPAKSTALDKLDAITRDLGISKQTVIKKPSVAVSVPAKVSPAAPVSHQPDSEEDQERQEIIHARRTPATIKHSDSEEDQIAKVRRTPHYVPEDIYYFKSVCRFLYEAIELNELYLRSASNAPLDRQGNQKGLKTSNQAAMQASRIRMKMTSKQATMHPNMVAKTNLASDAALYNVHGSNDPAHKAAAQQITRTPPPLPPPYVPPPPKPNPPPTPPNNPPPNNPPPNNPPPNNPPPNNPPAGGTGKQPRQPKQPKPPPDPEYNALVRKANQYDRTKRGGIAKNVLGGAYQGAGAALNRNPVSRFFSTMGGNIAYDADNYMQNIKSYKVTDGSGGASIPNDLKIKRRFTGNPRP